MYRNGEEMANVIRIHAVKQPANERPRIRLILSDSYYAATTLANSQI